MPSQLDSRIGSIIFDNIPDGIFTVDQEGRITSFNRAAEQITGWTRKEVIGTLCARVLRATAQRLNAPRYEVAAELERAALAELRQRRPDRAIETNVEFWAAVILDFAEVPPAMMPAMFTCGRTAGWCAHILEQKRLGKLVRPSAVYVGPGPRPANSVAGWNDIAHT